MPAANTQKAIAKAQGLTTYMGAPCLRHHDGLRYVKGNSCVHCMSQRQKTPQAKAIKAKHYANNREAYIDKATKAYEANRDAKIAYACERQKRNLQKIAAQRKQRVQDDVLYAIKERIRGLIKECLRKKGHKKQSQTTEILGCSIASFKDHIERQFVSGMTWQNRGDWEIDHIIPVSTANTEEELIRLNHFTNLRPLWRTENRSKSAKILFLI